LHKIRKWFIMIIGDGSGKEEEIKKWKYIK